MHLPVHSWSGSRKTRSGLKLLMGHGSRAHFAVRAKRLVARPSILDPEAAMWLEFHQLERRWEHLRVHEPHRQARLTASLAEYGQQIPIVVLLIGRPTPQTILTPAEPEQVEIWSRKVRAMGDPCLVVQPLVQP